MQGIISPIIVPFDDAGRVMVAELEQVVRYNIERMKVTGLYVCGGTSENFILSTEEKKLVLRVSLQAANAEVGTIGHVGSNNLSEALELTEYASKLGYDMLSSVPPFYYPFTFDETLGYYREILKATDLEVMIYMIPGSTHVNFSFQQLQELFGIPQISSIKYTSYDLFLLERLLLRCPQIKVFFGCDDILLAGLALGVHGAIGTTYNIVGDIAQQVWLQSCDGNLIAARKAQAHIGTMIDELRRCGQLQACKEVLKFEGINAGRCKPPHQGAINEFDLDRLRTCYHGIRAQVPLASTAQS